MKKPLSLLFILLFAAVSFAQTDTLFFEDFESSANLPVGWSTTTNANTYTGFYIGDTADANSGNYWDVLNNGSSQFVMTNDDIADDSLDAERLILPVQDFSLDSNLCLSFDIYLDKARGSSRCYIETSIDNGVTWVRIDSVERDWTQWQYRAVDLRAYNFQSNVLISFFWSDGNAGGVSNHSTGVAIDNIAIRHIPVSDLVLHEVYLSGDFTHYGQDYIDEGFAKLVISNYSLDSCLNVKVSYTTSTLISTIVDSVILQGMNSFGRDTLYLEMNEFDQHFYPEALQNISFEISNSGGDYSDVDNAFDVEYTSTSYNHIRTGRFFDTLQVSKNPYNLSFGDTVFNLGVVLEEEMANALRSSGLCGLELETPTYNWMSIIEAHIYYLDTITSSWVYFDYLHEIELNGQTPGEIEFYSTYNYYIPNSLPYSHKYLISLTNYEDIINFVNVGKRAKGGTILYGDYLGNWNEAENAYYPEFGVVFDYYCVSNVEEPQIDVFLAPNPSSGIFNYELETSINGQLQVLDLNGRIVFEQKISSVIGSIDLSHLDNAVYLLQLVESGVVITTEKLVIQK